MLDNCIYSTNSFKHFILFSFTKSGAQLSLSLLNYLKTFHCVVSSYTVDKFVSSPDIMPIFPSLSELTKKFFIKKNVLIYIGACGIAVRTISPYIQDKMSDPAVIVIDDMGNFVISLLSGHYGGANALAKKIADFLNAVPVITTATDIHNVFSIDTFAKKQRLVLDNKLLSKEISAKLLSGYKIPFICDFPIISDIPKEIFLDCTILNKSDSNIGFCITIYKNKNPFFKTLHLFPKIITLGIGCKKGICLEDLEESIFSCLEKNQISIETISQIATIDLKAQEASLKLLCKKYNWKFLCFSPAILNNIKGNFTSSDFVYSITGVDNICERAALAASKGKLLQKKYIKNKITISLAIQQYQINFNENIENEFYL